ncbi:MAG: acetyltransferase [Cyanobacteria bacterium K_DeepCast_150m_m2_101]|nr:acetyltransferase [Cyanobacteria bacterium K_DeepCast_150m_m2_101]
MFLKTRHDGSLMEVLTLPALFDPFATHLQGRLHGGEELQEPEPFVKADLIFPSGEPLPRCWLDPHCKQP